MNAYEVRKSALSAEVLLQILDNLPTSIFVKDEDLRFVFSNKMHCNLIGKTEQELLTFTDADFYEPLEAKEFMDADRGVIESGVVSVLEEMASPKKGMSTPVLSRKARLQGADGKLYIMGTNTDLTAIKKREEQYRALAVTVPVGVMQIEEGGEITFFNQLMQSYLGTDLVVLKVDEICKLIGKSSAEFPGAGGRFECTIDDPAGQARRFLVISSGWSILGKGRNRAAIVSMVDISENAELKRINDEIVSLNKKLALNMEQLKDAQDALVKKGRMEQMGQLTATIAHELRNPLGAVRTSVFLMERKLKGKELGVDPQFQRINNGVARCDNIITQLLDFSRTKQLECKSTDLDQWLEKIVEEEARRLPAAVKVTCHLGLDGRHVPFDPARLHRAISNLLANASEAMVGNGEQPLKADAAFPQITLSTKINDAHVEISVTDNGPGILPDIMSRIREPLFTTKSFGTGLGVPAIEQIANQHGGRLEISSEAGSGAVFSLLLPLVHIAEVAA